MIKIVKKTTYSKNENKMNDSGDIEKARDSFMNKKNKDGKAFLIYKTHIVASGLISTYGKDLIEAVKKRDQIAAESFKYMQEKVKDLKF